MDILFLLIPLSSVLVLGILAVFGWAVHRGQFEDLEREGRRILSETGADAPATPTGLTQIKAPCDADRNNPSTLQ